MQRDMHKSRNRAALVGGIKEQIADGTYDADGRKLDVATGRLLDDVFATHTGIDPDDRVQHAERWSGLD